MSTFPTGDSTRRRRGGGRPPQRNGQHTNGQRPNSQYGNNSASRRPVVAEPPAPVYEVADLPPEGTTFAALGVPAPIVEALARTGCEAPFPIQAATLLSSLAGRNVLGRARTGSGKTIAFAVPTVVAVAASTNARRPNAPRSLVIVPTRELAAQVAATTVPLAKAMGLRVAIVHGGVSQGPQVSALRQGVDVLVATPGRLEDLIEQRHCRLDAVEVCVLDEADHLADLGFLPAVKRILDQTPTGGQRLLFSATLDRAVDAVVRRYLDNPVTISVDSKDATPPDLEHHAFTVAPDDKAAVVRELASGRERSLLFTRTKHGAKKLAKDLTTPRHSRPRPARQPVAGPARPQPGVVLRRLHPGAGGHRRRRPRHPRGRHRPRRARGPSHRAQGLPAPLRSHRPCRRQGPGRHCDPPRPVPRRGLDDPPGRHPPHPRPGRTRFASDGGSHRSCRRARVPPAGRCRPGPGRRRPPPQWRSPVAVERRLQMGTAFVVGRRRRRSSPPPLSGPNSRVKRRHFGPHSALELDR